MHDNKTYVDGIFEIENMEDRGDQAVNHANHVDLIVQIKEMDLPSSTRCNQRDVTNLGEYLNKFGQLGIAPDITTQNHGGINDLANVDHVNYLGPLSNSSQVKVGVVSDNNTNLHGATITNACGPLHGLIVSLPCGLECECEVAQLFCDYDHGKLKPFDAGCDGLECECEVDRLGGDSDHGNLGILVAGCDERPTDLFNSQMKNGVLFSKFGWVDGREGQLCEVPIMFAESAADFNAFCSQPRIQAGSLLELDVACIAEHVWRIGSQLGVQGSVTDDIVIKKLKEMEIRDCLAIGRGCVPRV
ncbi:5-methyltetrahydropteroyltriglutamate--homocysteine S-methyltransferase [Sesbania bispinosa]|nr:5-methyltetrahydropteroyltriglutamate--homocysteine S-methyltransferase [Sesbania bispinosa]